MFLKFQFAAMLFLALGMGLFSSACKKDPQLPPGELNLTAAKIGTELLSLNTPLLNEELPYDLPIQLTFNQPLDPATVSKGISLQTDGSPVPFTTSLENGGTSLILIPDSPLLPQRSYEVLIFDLLKSSAGIPAKAHILQFSTKTGDFKVISATVNGVDLLSNGTPRDLDLSFNARISFNQPLNKNTVNSVHVKLFRPGVFANVSWSFENNDSTLILTADQPLRHFEKYTLSLSSAIQGPAGYQLSNFSRSFYTRLDPNPKFPVVSDEALLDLVQEKTFRYFWDFGHPVSGLARERNTSGDLVTSGGSGFGIMSIIVGIERGFITRSEGVARWQKIVNFLKNDVQRYHGAFPHWLNGVNGATIPFSTKDNGADLVETSFLMQGLLTVRQYLNSNDPTEQQIKTNIQTLWEEVEWDWFTRGGQDVLYWHWSPNYEWQMNHAIRGYNECLITYFLAAASPTHPIPASVYHKGWASNGGIKNNNSYYGYPLPLGYSLGGPLFFSHYSFLGLDPRNLKDTYADYWIQNKHHTLINRAYCIDNPRNYVGYSADCWGLTASDNHQGYNAHSPTNDLGVITPTAALSSFPYTPEESMQALKFFYYQLGDKLWGDYGFYDAFNPTAGWYASSTLAIDQGPIVVMMENHRTGLLWDLFMSSPEVATAAAQLGFTY